MSMNSEAWMFGSQLMNQSVENGSMPLGGDTPLTSLYSLSSRSRLRLTSASSSCRRAPQLISSIASWICFASDTTLLAAMGAAPGKRLRESSGGQLFGALACHQHRGVRRGHHPVLAVAGEHLAEHAVIEAEAAQQHVGGGHLEHLPRGQALDQVGHVLGDAQAEHRGGLVFLDHLLREHHVAEVGLPDFAEQHIADHFTFSFWSD